MTHANTASDPLVGALEHAAHLLPAQRPLDAFVHHNTLHAFEHLPFLEGVVAGARVYGARPFMPESWFIERWREGRIRDGDLDAALASLPDEAGPIPGLTERALVRRLMRCPIPPVVGVRPEWLENDTSLLRTLSPDHPRVAAERLLAAGPLPAVLRDLFDAARQATSSAPRRREPSTRARYLGVDPAVVDAAVEEVLIPWAAAYLDGGQAYWPIHDRDRGFFVTVLSHLVHGGPGGRRWMRSAVRRGRRLLEDGTDSLEACRQSLARLAVPREDVGTFVLETLLALRGYAGMFVQYAARPDLAPCHPPPTPLADFLAVRLLLDEAARETMADGIGSGSNGPASREQDTWSDAFELYHLATLAGLVASELTPAAARWLRDVAARTPETARCALWQVAYERRYVHEVLDAVCLHHRATRDIVRPPPEIQVVTCIDDREESFRRYLEEADPRVETLGYAGFYGVAMYFRPLGQPHHRPLCPAPVVPKHLVIEDVHPDDRERWEASRRLRARVGRAMEAGSVGSRTLVRGILTSLGGVGAALPLATRLLAPARHARVTATSPKVRTVLRLERTSDEREEGLLVGFSVDEMVDIVHGVLTAMGLRRFAPLVLVLGHGSHSLNNPHEAAHDCGACGGGRGGPNARAFATFANRPDVRAGLAARGLRIPDETWFVGGYHDTCDDHVDLYDLEVVPETHTALVDRVKAHIEFARRRDAHERCRRFEFADVTTDDSALRHVEDRSEDLAQPRPEYGHCTNALSIVGRRAWSRGLYLDRRAFLTSYDPEGDDDATILGNLLASVLPVGAGIALEYYFSFVDPNVLGCGTKLPHNIVGYFGVMNGHRTDLRTGLPWQMVELHEPMRLFNVIEATPERLAAVMDRHPSVRRLVENGWVLVAAFDPETGRAWRLEGGRFVPHEPERTALPVRATSRDWYDGRSDHLGPATITAGLSGEAA